MILLTSLFARFSIHEQLDWCFQESRGRLLFRYNWSMLPFLRGPSSSFIFIMCKLLFLLCLMCVRPLSKNLVLWISVRILVPLMTHLNKVFSKNKQKVFFLSSGVKAFNHFVTSILLLHRILDVPSQSKCRTRYCAVDTIQGFVLHSIYHVVYQMN